MQITRHFSLSFSPQGIVYLEEDMSSVSSSMLCTTQRDIPIPLCKDENEVSFFNADFDFTNDDTLPDQESEQRLPFPYTRKTMKLIFSALARMTTTLKISQARM